MDKNRFLEQVEDKCCTITYLSIKHILDKDIKVDDIEEFFTNYKNYHLYLNDFAGTIYNQYGSSVDSIYIEICDLLGVDIDNKYTLEHTIKKLEKQTPQLLLSLTNEDIQRQTIVHFDEKIEAIEGSSYYSKNLQEFKPRVDKLKENISLVKSALQI